MSPSAISLPSAPRIWARRRRRRRRQRRMLWLLTVVTTGVLVVIGLFIVHISKIHTIRPAALSAAARVWRTSESQPGEGVPIPSG